MNTFFIAYELKESSFENERKLSDIISENLDSNIKYLTNSSGRKTIEISTKNYTEAKLLKYALLFDSAKNGISIDELVVIGTDKVKRAA